MTATARYLPTIPADLIEAWSTPVGGASGCADGVGRRLCVNVGGGARTDRLVFRNFDVTRQLERSGAGSSSWLWRCRREPVAECEGPRLRVFTRHPEHLLAKMINIGAKAGLAVTEVSVR